MYCAKPQPVCQCLPRRSFPLRRGAEMVFSFFSFLYALFCTELYLLQGPSVLWGDLFLSRAKSIYVIGLLALCFGRIFWDNYIKEKL